MQCRYCLSDDNITEMIQPCKCEGTLRNVHYQCLNLWIFTYKKKFELTADTNLIQIYSIDCEICKTKIRFQQIYQDTLLNSLTKTIQHIFLDYRNLPFIILNIFTIYYLIYRCQFIINEIYASGCYFGILSPQTKSLMKFGNEFAVICVIFWYINDVLKYYKNLIWEGRRPLIRFLQIN